MRTVNDAFLDILGLLNDIWSYWKETELEGEINNVMTVLQRLLGCDLREAVTVANNLVTARMCEFERIIQTEAPELIAQYGREHQIGADRVPIWMAYAPFSAATSNGTF